MFSFGGSAQTAGSNALDKAPAPEARASRQTDRIKKYVVLFFLAAAALSGIFLEKSNAAVEPAGVFTLPQGNSKFDHTSQKHSQIQCDTCHVRRADATKPVLPGHRACISCHIKEFTSTRFGICSNCHEGITAVQPKVLTFPERQTFGTEFSHKTHATYVSGEKRADCSSCHTVAGKRTTFPGHQECYVCHKAPDQVKAGEMVGGASCSECHTLTGNKKKPSAEGRAYSFRFSHQDHAGRGIKCAECHDVLGSGTAVQVSVLQVREHRGGGFKGCASCHNGRRAFSGELGTPNHCARCHGRDMM